MFYTITRSGGDTTQPLTVNFSVGGSALKGSDYTTSGADSFGTTSGTVTIPANNTTATVTVDPTADINFEDNESVVLTITSDPIYNPVSPSSASGTITDDDSPPVFTFSASNYPVNEGAGTVTITVNKSGNTLLPASVNYSTSDGTAAAGSDYTTASGTLTFAPGDTSKQFTVTITSDTLYEAAETINLALSTPVGATLGTPNTATATIANDDPVPTISIGSGSGTEGGNIDFIVLQSAVSGLDTTFEYSTTDGTATSADYTPATSVIGTIPAGSSSTIISIPSTEDSVYEGNENFFVGIANPTNATITVNSGVGTITENDSPPSFTIDDVTHDEGNSSTTSYTFTVTRTGSTAVGSTVNFTTLDGTATVADSDYQTNSGTLTFAAGDTTKTITVLVNGDTKYENGEAFTVHLSNATDATIGDADGTGTITNDDGQPSISINSVSANESAGTIDFTVTQSSASAFATTFQYSTADGTATAGTDYTGATNAPGSIPAGSTTTTISIPITNDSAYEGPETFTVALSTPNNATLGTATGTGTIVDNDNPPTSLVVTKTADTNDGVCSPTDCSLREAIQAANFNSDLSFITFNIPGAGPHTITLTGGELSTTADVYIVGPTATSIIVNGGGASRVFHIGSGTSANLTRLNITNGFVSSGCGGGIQNDHGTLTLSESTVYANSADQGAGVCNLGSVSGTATMTVANSTISNNTATGQGGGISNQGQNSGTAQLFVHDSTIAGNTATGGAGVYNYGFNSGRTRFSRMAGPAATLLRPPRAAAAPSLRWATI
jgi:CSLREA domain-containing protein